MRVFYILIVAFMSASHAGTIPPVYECLGGYRLPEIKAKKEFCSAVFSLDSEVEKIKFIEGSALEMDLSSVSCSDEIERLIYPVLFRFMAESIEPEDFFRLNKKLNEYVNYIVDSLGRDITPAGVAALCGYDTNLEKLIAIGGVPKARILIEMQDLSGSYTRSFSLSEAIDFNEPIKATYESLSSEDGNIVYERIIEIISKHRNLN
ncbi:hypothetical protein C3B51_22980 [Pseudoalteromonas rubra]|uniref:DUF3015 domain-containing protein n=1 Tax=Pseudoalteromonas rubra TaxID=43658 RepID=A0A4Q7DZ17_9GAMM|nr:hypothetical protein [Pseudoalteromonas rubra]RZM70379.1 hypothetical protein C3B51_22980 [Pseudoalteromonas rubra]